jgi:hypothetical protein
MQGKTSSALQLGMQLAPRPGTLGVAQRRGRAVWFHTISDGFRPSRGNRGQPFKENPPPLKLTSPSMKRHEPLESRLIGSVVEIADRSAKLPDHSSTGLTGPVGCQGVLESTKNVFDLEPSDSPNPCSEDQE